MIHDGKAILVRKGLDNETYFSRINYAVISYYSFVLFK
jgi:hypothetical protein